MRKKIIVVDDEPDIAISVRYILKDNDYEIISVENGEKCLELLKNNENKPDLILLDIMMPGVSGWEVFNRIKKNPLWEKIPVVFLTARVDMTAEKAGNFLGDDYIEKPYDPIDLKKRIEKLLNKN